MEMPTTQELLQVKETILSKITNAAQNGNIEAISKWSKAAEQCENLIREKAELDNLIESFIGSTLSNKDTVKPESKGGTLPLESLRDSGKISPKKEGKLFRERWVKMLLTKGIELNGHNKRYYTNNGINLSIAFANELDKPNLLDKWFLGLKDESIDIAVLLCKDLENNFCDFVIPVVELGTKWKLLSRSGGEVKFNIRKKGGDFFLVIPGNHEPIVLNKYLSNYSLIK